MINPATRTKSIELSQIRKMFEVIEKNITLLRRTQIGEITLGGLSRGEYVPLNAKELKYLKSLKK